MNILTTNSAFELLRGFKEVSEETEKLVSAIMRRKYPDLTIRELTQVFENGIAGDYGKIYQLDPQTLLAWIEKYWKNKTAPKNYLETGLLNPSASLYHRDYPQKAEQWHKEINKCYRAFLNGVKEENFHPHCYDRMMLDDKIKLNSYREFYKGLEQEEIDKAKQKIIKNLFTEYQQKGYTFVYFIQQ